MVEPMPAHPAPIRPAKIILGVMVVGLLLRLSQLGLTVFNLDEAALAIFATQMGHFKAFPLVGIQTSLGFHNPPLFIHLMAPFFAFTADPRWAMAALALSGTAAIGLVALTAKRLWGPRAAIAAAAIVAFSPNAVEHSRQLWGHDTMILWGALCCYATVRGIQDRRRKWLALGFCAAGAAQACHLSGVFLWLFPLNALLIFKPWQGGVALPGFALACEAQASPSTRGCDPAPLQGAGNSQPCLAWWTTFFAGLLFAILLYLPWLIHDASNGWEEAKLIASIISSNRGFTGPVTPTPPALAVTLILSDGFHSDLLYRLYAYPALWGLLPNQLIMGLLLLWGFASVARHFITDVWCSICFVMLVAPALVYLLFGAEAVSPYFLPCFVPATLLVALALRRAKRTLWIAVALIAATGLWNTLFVRYVVATATPEDGVSAVLRFKHDAVAHCLEQANGEPFTIMQDGRSPEAGGDLWLVYINHWVSGGQALARDPNVPLIFVIRDNETTMRPEVALWLDLRTPESFGNLRVHELRDADANRWRDLTRRFPSSGQGE